ncbi:5-azacytidine-induced protein 2 [Onychomys torridus]|uniref:5-azacytidine-induced protein 2 n=1 Tax=Onychomys torridus TaxID=38674 RepID=UPI00167F7759|nr:5-azacytidine-induced protein 2 [Onychomys torridus]XP_036049151.1 5-azacytidine-induced protein 2 [Onychomys torridus]XP_036049152.1 5-azacytidine-induced protein 2 [Onychomys torridus]
MDTLVEDDICILNPEKAHRRETATPLSVYSGEESVASHFALVTAYEDIKKRLKDSEKENSFLKKRIRALEEKLVGARVDEETSSVGREQVNKAYHAYREVCIDRDNLKNKLEKINKDNTESLKVLNEQLQSKEVELLQLRTEVETQQVMRNLNPPSSNWEVEKLSYDLKIHSLEQELELMRKECNHLTIELQKAKQTGPSQEDILQDRDLIRPSLLREEHGPHQGLLHSDNMQHAYWELKREMSNLHLVTQVQAELLRKLKASAAIKKACTPAGCVEDLGRDSAKLHLTNFTATYKRHPPLSPNGKATCYAPSSPLAGDVKVLSDKAVLQSWTDNERLIPNDGMDFQEHHSYGRNSLEDNSWVFPSPPKSSETAFGENKSKTFPLANLPPLHYLDQHNQNCLYKS